MNKKLRVHAIQHVPFEGPGHIADWAEERGHELQVISISEGQELPSLHDSDILIVLGGPMSANDEIPWLRSETLRIAEFVRAKKPVVGICLGAQILARILGAEVFRAPSREIGWFDVELSTGTLKTFHWHGEQFTLPPHALTLGHSRLTKVQGFRYEEHVVAWQFHPEVNEQCVQLMIEFCGDEIDSAQSGEQAPIDIFRQASQYCEGHRQLLYATLDRLAELKTVTG
jgi:GMP synthase-like glutamine amidotransferase